MKSTASKVLFAIVAVLLLSASELPAQIEHREFDAVAERVSDGDTANFTVLDGQNAGTKLRVRFAGIDAPEVKHAAHEPGQPFGPEARAFVEGELKGERAKLVVVDVDRYRRSVSLVYVGDRLLNEEIVRRGLAHVYRSYLRTLPSTVASALLRAEQDAKEAKRGVWSLSNPEEPSEYRKRVKKGGG